MTRYTNKSPGVRVFHVKGPAEGSTVTVALGPGQTEDLDLVNADDPVLKGMIDSGELVEGDAQDEDDDAKQERQRRSFQNDPRLQENRLLAEQAGRELADALPEGTDTEGGSESTEARERLGLDSEGNPQQGTRERVQPAVRARRVPRDDE